MEHQSQTHSSYPSQGNIHRENTIFPATGVATATQSASKPARVSSAPRTSAYGSGTPSSATGASQGRLSSLQLEQYRYAFSHQKDLVLNDIEWRQDPAMQSMIDTRESTIVHRLENRTRAADYTRALSFEIADPMWMLTRQWQFGRFEGNDCGSIVSAKIRVERTHIDGVQYGDTSRPMRPYNEESPLEYDIEKRNRAITPYVRVESAVHLTKLLRAHSSLQPYADAILTLLRQRFPLQESLADDTLEGQPLEQLKRECNDKLQQFLSLYARRSFDGYRLTQDLEALKKELHGQPFFANLSTLLDAYADWFQSRYTPLGPDENCWNDERMGYEASLTCNSDHFVAKDYHSGNLGWYSFDLNPSASATATQGPTESKLLSYIPTTVNFPGAPKRRLWEVENRHVSFGCWQNDDVTLLASAVTMQFVSMYSNDWLMVPLETVAGSLMRVEDILLKDTFGEYISFHDTPETVDAKSPETGFMDRWSLFANARSDAYSTQAFAPNPGLLFPSTLQRSEESEPIEEVLFLRDEMANMLWGVENTIDSGADEPLDGRTLSQLVLERVDEERGIGLQADEQAQYSFLVQNRVPLNWIPFLPQHLQGEMRDIRFRRGKMPVFLHGAYHPARPSTAFLALRHDANGAVLPFFLNEEELQGYGTRVILSAQRTRWFNGKSFTWHNLTTKASDYQANSGLLFDSLIDANTDRPIRTQAYNPLAQ